MADTTKPKPNSFMPITHTIADELEAITFCKEMISKEIKNQIGSSEFIQTKRENYKNAYQRLMSVESRLQKIEARSKSEQPRLF
jgi:hypothetical protein